MGENGILTLDEINDLISCFSDRVRMCVKQEASHMIATHIHRPKLPEALSESIVAHAIIRGLLFKRLGPFLLVKRGGGADVVLIGRKKKYLVECKANQYKPFQEFGDKDYKADFVVWLMFGESFVTGDLGSIPMLVMPNPGKHLSKWGLKVHPDDILRNWKGSKPGYGQLNLKKLGCHISCN